MAELEDALRKAARAKLKDAAQFILSKAQENLVEHRNVDTGDLLGSGFVRETEDGYIVGFDAPHALAIEFGSRPHMPPVEKIEGWARRKLGKNDEEARKVAWAVAINMKKYGTVARPFFRPAVNEATVKYGIKGVF